MNAPNPEPSVDLYADDRAERRVRGRKSPLLVVSGASGGVGVSTVALMLCEIAATVGRMPRVVLVDARSGRTDIRTWLVVNDKAPSVNNSRVEGDAKVALVDVGRLNSFRPSTVNDVSFAAILTSPEVFTPYEHVLGAIDAARNVVDLVVVDCGPYTIDPDSCFQHVAIPLMSIGGWGLMVTQMDRVSTKATAQMLGNMKRHQVERDKMAFLVNNVDPKFADAKVSGSGDTRGSVFVNQLLPLANHAGSVPADHEGIRSVMVTGQIPTRNTPMAAACANLLQRVTGRSDFEALAVATSVDRRMLDVADGSYDHQDSATLPVPAKTRKFLRKAK